MFVDSAPTTSEMTLESVAHAVDILWLLTGCVLVFMMQTGFAMLEVGSVSIRNSKNILMKVSILIFIQMLLLQ